MIIINSIKAVKRSDINKSVPKEDVKYTVLTAMVILLFMIMTSHPNYYILGAKTGIKFCGNILIPSLFPFIFLTSFIIKSGISKKISKVLNPITKFLFYLPGCTGPTIILSFLGGYPVGAKGVKDLYDEKLINNEQAKRMLYFTVGSGPAFTISVVGIGLIRSYTTGLIIFISQVLSMMLIGISLGVYTRIKKVHFYSPKLSGKKNNQNTVINSIINSSYDAVINIINMCALIMIFCCLISITEYAGLNNVLSLVLSKINVPHSISQNIIPVIFEVTSACTQSVNSKLPLELISFAIGWAGICIQFQIFSIIEGIRISHTKFILFRFFQGMLSGLITRLFIDYYKISILAFSNTNISQINCLPISTSFLGSISLLITCLCFIVSVHEKPKLSEH